MHDDDQAVDAIAVPDPFANAIAFLEQTEGSSTEKVPALAAALMVNAGETEQGAQVLAVVQLARQFIDPAAILPDDPAELDRMLVRIAQTALAARSTEAAHFAVVATGNEPW